MGTPAVASIGSDTDVDYSQVVSINLSPPLLGEKHLFVSGQASPKIVANTSGKNDV